MGRVILSHSSSNPGAVNTDFTLLRQELKDRLNARHIPDAELLTLFDELCEFELGRFLIVNKGLNAHWTNELVRWTSGDKRQLTRLERIIFEKLPATLATRERYGIFRRELQKRVPTSGVMASVPCGLMHDLLELKCPRSVRLVGVDLDGEALSGARTLADERGYASQMHLHQTDAWDMTFTDEFEVLTSNGLNIYEPDDEKVKALYKIFFRALKKGGTLITSFMTPSPLHSPDSSWRMERIEASLLLLQKRLFIDILDARWSAMRTEAQTYQQLTDAGFDRIRFIYDRAGMFPTVLAEKR